MVPARAHSTTLTLVSLAFALVLAASVALFVLLGRHMTIVGITDMSAVTIATAAALAGSVRAVSWPIAPAAGFVCGLVTIGVFSVLAWFAPAALLLLCAAVAETLAARSWRATLSNTVWFLVFVPTGGLFALVVLRITLDW